MKKLIIYGLGDFASMMRHYFEKSCEFQVVAYCADAKFIKTTSLDGLPVVEYGKISDTFPAGECCMFVAVGYSRMRAREAMFLKAKELGYTLVNYVSKKALVDETLVLGNNNIILQGSQIEPFCKIGDNNIIWSSVVISHDVTIQDHCFIASQSLVGGGSRVNDNCFLGFGATVVQKIVLGRETLVGAKSLLLESTEPYGKFLGIPGRRVVTHEDGGIII